MELQLVTPPAEPVISLADAKLHLRVDHDADDSLIAGLVSAGTEWVQSYTERQLVTATYRVSVENWRTCGCRGKPPELFELPRTPVQAVNFVSYVDPEGNAQTLSPTLYRANRDGLYFLHNLPSLSVREDAVRVNYDAGYGTAAQVPDLLKVALKLWVGEFYAHRETSVVGTIVNELPLSIYRLCDPFRVRGVR